VSAALDTPPSTPGAAGAPRAAVRRPPLLLAVAAPLAAMVFALLVSSIALVASGNDPLQVYRTMLTDGTQLRSILITVNNAVPLYLAGRRGGHRLPHGAVQHRGRGPVRPGRAVRGHRRRRGAAARRAARRAVLAVAMAVGASWAGVAAVLKVTRGVSEVISTILLNVIAAGIAAYLLAEHFQERVEGSNNSTTAPLPESARFPSLDPVLTALGVEVPQGTRLGGFLLVAVAVGIGYWLLVSRSRFGFELKASGLNPFAAVASGIEAKRTTVMALLLSGAIAGLVGLAQVLGQSYNYGLSFTAGLGFTGIGVALLGRGSPVGIAFAALLFAFLERSSATLQRIDVPTEIYVIMQGSIRPVGRRGVRGRAPASASRRPNAPCGASPSRWPRDDPARDDEQHRARVAGVQRRPAPRRGTAPAHRCCLGALGLLVLLSVVRVVSGAEDVTSSGTFGAALRLAVPIGLAGLGGLWAERAGVVNIGLEGMLILGTWFGAYVGFLHGPWWGVVAGLLAGAVGGLLHAVATVSFGVDHIVSGVAINLLGAGVAQYLSQVFYGDGQIPGAGPDAVRRHRAAARREPARALERTRPAGPARTHPVVPARRRRRSARRPHPRRLAAHPAGGAARAAVVLRAVAHRLRAAAAVGRARTRWPPTRSACRSTG
jgi:simple sugar transport system permease protein